MKKPATLATLLILALVFTSCAQEMVLPELPTRRLASLLVSQKNQVTVSAYIRATRLHRLPELSFELVDNLILFAAQPVPDGGIVFPEFDDAVKQRLSAAKAKASFSTGLCVADFTDNGAMHAIVNDPDASASFVQSSLDFIQTHGFRGLDLDWEYPNESDMAALGNLIRALKESFAPRGLYVSIAVSPSRLPASEVLHLVDLVHTMTYDDWGEHASAKNTRTHVARMLRQGVEASSITVGIPFYGRGTGIERPWRDAVTFRELAAAHRLSEYDDQAGGYFFNGPATVRAKVRSAQSLGLGGVFIWELSQDTATGTLTRAIADEARK